MPSEVMDQRRLSSLCSPPMTSSFFSDEIRHGAQRKVGFWKPESMHVHHGKEGMPLLFGNKSLSSSPLEKFQSVNIISAESLQPHHTRYIEKQKASMSHEQLVEAERAAGFSMTSWKATEGDFSSRSNLFVQPASLYAKGNKFYSNGVPCENGFFSSSLPDLFNTKFALSSNDALFGQSVNGVNPDIREEASLSSMEEKEIEAQTIGNLLPDDDDLLSGVVDELEYTARPNPGDDLEEDLFYSGGGMELDERVDRKYSKPYDLANGVLNGQQRILNSSFSDEKSYSEYPSRALFVRNVHNNIEDAELRLLFEQYGDIHTLYTDCKNHGFVMLSYYDIRSACNAQKALQNKPLRQKKLDVRFSVSKDNLLEKDVNQGAVIVLHPESSIPNEEILHIISGYGEIKEIHEIPHKSQKLIEFYDVRAAEAALRALNRSDIAGNRFKIEPSLFRDARRGLMQRNSPELERDNACGLRPRENITTGAITCNGLSSGSNRGLPSVSPASIRPFVENTFGGTTSGVSHYLSSPAGSASAGSHLSGFNDLSHSLGNMNLGLESIRNFQPHSLPDYQDGLRNSISYSSPNTMSAMAINIARQAEGVDNRSVTRICTAGLGSQSSEREQAFGASGNGNCPLHGHQFVWTNRNSSHQQLQRPMMWPDSSTFANIPAHSLSQLHGNPRAHSPLLNSAVPLHQHHVGSAPAINPSLWDTCQVYTGDLTDSPNFHPGSIGSMGFPGSSALRSFELSSHNIFHHVRGNYVEPLIASPQIGLPSPQQKYHVFHGRNSMITMPNTIFDAPSDKVRSRRSDANSNQTDNKKQYELDIERIVCGEDGRTTLMIKNIPNKYTSKMLLAAIDEHHRGTYDFIYLPIDFKNKCNVGYAFINMIDPQQIIPFYKAFNGKKWEKFNSEKVASLAYARIQGKTALIAHFQNSSLMNEDKRCRPILFHTDGPNAGDQEPFPMGTNIRSRPGRSRAYNSEDNHLGSPSSSSDCEENLNGIDSSSGSRKD